jgi:ubiquinone/menaquinone biosynthesis C-methylase UbiE
MSYEGAWWLDRADREAKQRPDHVLDVIGVRAGQTVADVGCGSGYFTVRIAKRVAPGGRVLAVDVQPQMLDLLEQKVAKEKVDGVVPILATETDAKLPAHEVDIALMVDVYHELAHPDATMAQVATALRPGGKLVLVEYRAEDPKVEIKPEHKMTLAQIKSELGAAHFTFVSSDESLPEQRIVTFAPEVSATNRANDGGAP